jgi:hypothetical protein
MNIQKHFCKSTNIWDYAENFPSNYWLDVQGFQVKSRIVLALVLICLIIVPSVSTLAYSEKQAHDVARVFCKLDFEGVRLSSRTWNKILPYVAWEEEPGWDIALAIKRYAIGKVVVEGQRAVVTVRYDIERSCPHSFELTQLREFETAELELVRKNGSWVINSKVLYPRVSSDILCKKYSCCE